MLVESTQKTEPRRKVQQLEPINPEQLEESLRRGMAQAKSGVEADLASMGLEWVEGD